MFNWWKPKTKPANVSSSQVLSFNPLNMRDLQDVPRYPPFKRGIPPIGVELCLSSQAELIERIEGALSITREEFNRLFMPILRSFTSIVHLLPASEAHHHRAAGGLIRHSLEVSYWAIMHAKSKVFGSRSKSFARFSLNEVNKVYSFACAILGLVHDLGKVVSDMRIISLDGQHKWNPYEEFFSDYLNRIDGQHYQVFWNRYTRIHNQHQVFSVFMTQKILHHDSIMFLTFNGETSAIMEHLLLVLAGGDRVKELPDARLLLEIVKSSDSKSVARDLAGETDVFDSLVDPLPLFQHITVKLHHFVISQVVSINRSDSHLFFCEERLFVKWDDKLCSMIVNAISKDNIAIPSSSDVLLNLLMEWNVVISPSPVSISLVSKSGITFNCTCFELSIEAFEDVLSSDLVVTTNTISVSKASKSQNSAETTSRERPAKESSDPFKDAAALLNSSNSHKSKEHVTHNAPQTGSKQKKDTVQQTSNNTGASNVSQTVASPKETTTQPPADKKVNPNSSNSNIKKALSENITDLNNLFKTTPSAPKENTTGKNKANKGATEAPLVEPNSSKTPSLDDLLKTFGSNNPSPTSTPSAAISQQTQAPQQHLSESTDPNVVALSTLQNLLRTGVSNEKLKVVSDSHGFEVTGALKDVFRWFEELSGLNRHHLRQVFTTLNLIQTSDMGVHVSIPYQLSV